MNQANLWDLLMMNILIFTICVFQYLTTMLPWSASKSTIFES